MKVSHAYVSAHGEGVIGLRCFEPAGPNTSGNQLSIELPHAVAKDIAIQLIGRFDRVLAARVHDQLHGT